MFTYRWSSEKDCTRSTVPNSRCMAGSCERDGNVQKWEQQVYKCSVGGRSVNRVVFDNSLKEVTSSALRSEEGMEQGSSLLPSFFIRDFHCRQEKTGLDTAGLSNLSRIPKHFLGPCSVGIRGFKSLPPHFLRVLSKIQGEIWLFPQGLKEGGMQQGSSLVCIFYRCCCSYYATGVVF